MLHTNKGGIKINTTEHHVGFPVANDMDGNLTNARDAEKGRIYYCPFCQCEMFPKTSHLGTPFFAKRKGAEHTNSICKTIEKTGKYHSFSASPDPSSLIASFCHVPVSRSKKPKTVTQPKTPTSQDCKTSPEDATMVPFTSLSQVYEYGNYLTKPFQRCGNYYISDYYIHYKWSQQFFTQPNFVLGSRIIHARFRSYNKQCQTLRFVIFKKNEYEIHFEVYIKDRNLYNKIQKQVYVPVFNPDTGKSSYKSMDALIASTEWIYSHKQIYPIEP